MNDRLDKAMRKYRADPSKKNLEEYLEACKTTVFYFCRSIGVESWFEDAFQDLWPHLIDAANNFDITRNTSFTSFLKRMLYRKRNERGKKGTQNLKLYQRWLHERLHRVDADPEVIDEYLSNRMNPEWEILEREQFWSIVQCAQRFIQRRDKDLVGAIQYKVAAIFGDVDETAEYLRSIGKPEMERYVDVAVRQAIARHKDDGYFTREIF